MEHRVLVLRTHRAGLLPDGACATHAARLWPEDARPWPARALTACPCAREACNSSCQSPPPKCAVLPSRRNPASSRPDREHYQPPAAGGGGRQANWPVMGHGPHTHAHTCIRTHDTQHTHTHTKAPVSSDVSCPAAVSRQPRLADGDDGSRVAFGDGSQAGLGDGSPPPPLACGCCGPSGASARDLSPPSRLVPRSIRIRCDGPKSRSTHSGAPGTRARQGCRGRGARTWQMDRAALWGRTVCSVRGACIISLSRCHDRGPVGGSRVSRAGTDGWARTLS